MKYTPSQLQTKEYINKKQGTQSLVAIDVITGALADLSIEK